MILIAALLAALGTAQADPKPILEKLGAVLKVTERPSAAKPGVTSISVTLVPQGDDAGKAVVSFGVPFGPDVLAEDRKLRVLAADGQEVPVYTQPLAYWWIDGKKGTLRSVLATSSRFGRLMVLSSDTLQRHSRNIYPDSIAEASGLTRFAIHKCGIVCFGGDKGSRPWDGC